MKKILIVAPHPDDEVLGAGGFIAKQSEEGNQVYVLIVSGHLPPLYSREVFEETVSEAYEAFKVLGVEKVKFLEIPATMVGHEIPGSLNAKIVSCLEEFEPDIVLCPYPDRHIDHRVIFESVMVACRPVGIGRRVKILAAYETLSETHWNAPHIEPNFVPNWVINISSQIEKKLDALMCYKSQIPDFPGARSVEAVRALALFRGSQSGFGYGEAFHIIRMTD
jgi:LmbE family N-acetylglucosaminyl deacetylase